MATSISSSDFVALCLLLVDFDLDATIAEVIGREEAFEQSRGIYFGVGSGDFPNAFYALVLRGDIECSLAALPDLLAATPLRQWLNIILHLNGFYTKDTEDWWTEDDEVEPGSDIDYTAYNAPLRTLFADPAAFTTNAVRSFFHQYGIDMVSLMRHFH